MFAIYSCFVTFNGPRKLNVFNKNIKTTVPHFWSWVLLVFLALVWGTSPILVKKALQSYSGEQVAALRISTAFFISLPLIIPRLKLFTKQNIKWFAIVGLFGTAIPSFLFAKAQEFIPSALAGMLNSLTAVFALLIGILFYNSRFAWLNVMGVLVGLVGALGLVISDHANAFAGINLYALLIVLATACYGFSANVVKYRLYMFDGVTIAALAFACIGLLALVWLFFTDFSYSLTTPDYLKNYGYIFLLSLLASVVAVIMHSTLIKLTSTLFATSTSYLIPFFAMTWGIADGEIITWWQLVWVCVIVLGLYLTRRG